MENALETGLFLSSGGNASCALSTLKLRPTVMSMTTSTSPTTCAETVKEGPTVRMPGKSNPKMAMRFISLFGSL
jgi:hypothetical protein